MRVVPPPPGYEYDQPEEKERRVGGSGFLQATPDKRTWNVKPTWRVKTGDTKFRRPTARGVMTCDGSSAIPTASPTPVFRTGLDWTCWANSHQTLQRAPCIEDVDVGDVVTLRDTELAPGERHLPGLSF